MELTLDQALQKGIEAHKAGNAQEADRYYTAILKAQPKHPDANHNMGVLAVGVGKVNEALPFLKTALEANPNIGQFWVSYIDALIKLERIDDAKAVFDQAKSKGAKGEAFDQIEKRLTGVSTTNAVKNSNVQDPPAEILEKAIELREAGKYDEAIEFLKNKIDKFASDPTIPSLISHCYMLKSDLEMAKIYLDIAKNIDPDTASVGWNETRFLLTQEKLDEALDVAKKTNKLFPDDVEGMGILGSCLRKTNNFDEGLKYLNRAIKLNSNYAEAYIQIALISLARDNKVHAMASLEKAHQLKPHIKQIWDLLIGLKIEFQQFEDTINLAKPMIKTNPMMKNS